MGTIISDLQSLSKCFKLCLWRAKNIPKRNARFLAGIFPLTPVYAVNMAGSSKIKSTFFQLLHLLMRPFELVKTFLKSLIDIQVIVNLWPSQAIVLHGAISIDMCTLVLDYLIKRVTAFALNCFPLRTVFATCGLLQHSR